MITILLKSRTRKSKLKYFDLRLGLPKFVLREVDVNNRRDIKIRQFAKWESSKNE